MDKSGLPEYRPAADDAFALPLKTREVLDKIDKYEHFITTKLEPDLNKTITERNALFKDIGEYVELKENITMIQRTNPTLEHVKTQFDLGSDFYVQAVM
jgi:lantibiotic modifying enzyme